MHTLEEWMKQLLIQPVDELNRKYAFTDAAEQEVKSLADVDSMLFGSACVSDPILHELHQKIRGQECEAVLWDAIIFHLRDPLPTSLAHDLIDRDIVVSQMGHTRQNDEIQLRLASLGDEALLTLVWDMFHNPAYTVAQLENLLSHHPDNRWLLNQWEHAALLNKRVGDREKEIVFHRWAWEHPDRGASAHSRHPFDVPSPERYLEIMAGKERERLRIEREAKEEELRVERVAQQRRLEVQQLAEKMLGQEEIERILSAKDPDELLALASNPYVPVHWIQKLINCHQVKGARQIREAAQENLRTHSPQSE